MQNEPKSVRARSRSRSNIQATNIYRIIGLCFGSLIGANLQHQGKEDSVLESILINSHDVQIVLTVNKEWTTVVVP